MKITSENIVQYNQPEEDDSFDFKEVIVRYAKFWPFFLTSISIALLVAFIVNQHTPPVYKIESKFLIQENGNAINLFDFGEFGENGILPKGQKIANETIILKSRTVAHDVLDQLPFDVEYYEPGIFINSEIYEQTPIKAEVDWTHTQLTNGFIKVTWYSNESYTLEFLDSEYQKVIPGKERMLVATKPELKNNKFSFNDWIELDDLKFRINFIGPDKIGSLILKFRDRESLLRQYTGENLQIFPADKVSSILLFSLSTNQPQKGRDYLNLLMQVFLDNELDEKNSIARNTISFIDSQLSGISDSLSYTENKLEKFRSSNKTYDISTEGSTIFEKLSELEKSLAEEKFKREYYQNLQDYLVREDYSEIIVPSGLGIDDPFLNKLIVDLMALQSEKSRFLATQTENSPTVIEVTKKIKDQNTSIKEALKNVNNNSSLLIQDLEKRIAKIESQFGKLPQTEQDLLNIKRKYSLNESIYTFLLQRRAESAISLASNRPSNKIIEPAVLNFIPMRLRPILNYFLAMLLGFVVPVAIVFGIDLFSVKIKEIKEAEKLLRVSLLSYIGRNKNYPTLVVLNEPRAGITEAFRALRTNINFILPKDKKGIIAVTSTIAGEGKTFCAMNLASVYSIGGKKTILVGCDMHKRFKLDAFKISNTVGLSTYLSSQIDDIQSLIQTTEYKNLDVLVPGPIPPNPAELLINERFEQLIGELKHQYDIIILDTSPIGLTNETLYLTSISDLTIFILRQDYSDKSCIEYLNSLKEKKGIKNIYAVINDVDEKHLNYHGYGYGYYAEDKKKSKILKKVLKSSDEA